MVLYYCIIGAFCQITDFSTRERGQGQDENISQVQKSHFQSDYFVFLGFALVTHMTRIWVIGQVMVDM